MPRRRSRRRRRAPATDSGLEKSYFSGSSLNYRSPCTKREGRPCGVFKDISIWNEYFWQVGLELRELSPAELSLVEVDDAFVPLELAQPLYLNTTGNYATRCHRVPAFASSRFPCH
ncbi:hypothetical protein MRX96_022091 [Rhipicephalus microplus]